MDAETATTDVVEEIGALVREGVVEEETPSAPPPKEEAGGQEEAPQEAEEAPEPVLDDEAIARLVEDPRVVSRVLEQSQAGRARLDSILQNVLAEYDQTKEQEQQAAVELQSWQEEYTKAYETGDFEALGKLAARQYEVASQKATEQQAIDTFVGHGRDGALANLDAAVKAVYAEELQALSKEELAALMPNDQFGNFRWQSDAHWMASVLGALKTKSSAAGRAAPTDEDKAAKAAATATRARAAGGSLPPASAPKRDATGKAVAREDETDISELLRKGGLDYRTLFESE